MAARHKFLFEKDFDEETEFFDEPDFASGPMLGEGARTATEEEPEPEPESPTFSQEDIDAARDEGYRAGHAEGLETGRAEATAAAEQANADALDRLGQRLDELSTQVRGASEQRSSESLEVALTLVRKLFPALTRRHGQAEIETLIVESLERLREEPRVVVRVADAQLDTLRERIDGLAAKSGFAGKVVLLSDEDLAPGDARADWADGGAERDTARVWREIENAAARALGADRAADALADGSASDNGTHETAGQADGSDPATTGETDPASDPETGEAADTPDRRSA